MEDGIFEWCPWQSQILGFVKSSVATARSEFGQYTGWVKELNRKINHTENMLRGYSTGISDKTSILPLDSRSQALCGH